MYLELIDNILLSLPLILRAKDKGKLSKMLSINSRYTKAEAYTHEDQFKDILLQFDPLQPSNAVKIEHYPNPFKEQTQIQIQLDEAGPAVLYIYTNNGQLIKKWKLNLSQGINLIPLKHHIFPSSGSYLYTLIMDDYRGSGKLLFQD